MRTKQIAMKFTGWMRAVLAVAVVSVVAACGGSDGSGGGSPTNTNPLNGGALPPSPTQQAIAPNAANTVPITVGPGVSGVINIPTVSVTVCPPGTTTNCQTISNVQVDTGSFGLRLVSSALSPSVLNSLPVSTLAGNGSPLAECAAFADGITWGTVRTATVKIGGETTKTGIPVQIIGDLPSSAVSAGDCATSAAQETSNDLGANGILGIGTAPNDCGSNCSDPTGSNYFVCPGGTSCTRTALTAAQQVANPVASFPVDNNGVIVQMTPSVSNLGSPSASGTLVFGIGTQSNNVLVNAQVFTTDTFGNLNNSVFNGATVQAFLDSGSNAYFFADTTLPLCTSFPDFYCPTSAQSRSITLVGLNGATAAAPIGILSAATLFSNGSNFAFNDLGGQIAGSGTFDLGLPFFYGRHVYYGIDQTLSGGPAPFVAY